MNVAISKKIAMLKLAVRNSAPETETNEKPVKLQCAVKRSLWIVGDAIRDATRRYVKTEE